MKKKGLKRDCSTLFVSKCTRKSFFLKLYLFYMKLFRYDLSKSHIFAPFLNTYY